MTNDIAMLAIAGAVLTGAFWQHITDCHAWFVARRQGSEVARGRFAGAPGWKVVMYWAGALALVAGLLTAIYEASSDDYGRSYVIAGVIAYLTLSAPVFFAARSRSYWKSGIAPVVQPRSIEPAVQPLCDALNAIPSVSTLYSCHGHPNRSAHPFVTFCAPPDVAFKIHRLLGPGHGDGSLQYCWWMRARFQDDGTMQYHIEPHDYRVSGGTSVFQGLRWSRKTMDQDLARLAAMISQMKIPTPHHAP